MRAVALNLLRRLLGLSEPPNDLVPIPAEEAGAVVEPVSVAPEPPPAALACPSCGVLLSPPPTGDRRCPSCRQPIIVRHLEGRTVLLDETALEVFNAERRREAEERVQTDARQRWLRLAHGVNAEPTRSAKLATAPISADVVAACRALYLATAERAVKAARRERRWGDIGRIRREQARALFEEAGAPRSPSDEIVDLQREGTIAVLRSLQPLAREVELVSTRCCPACRRDDGETFKIVDEIRIHRLPHADCTLGLCGCDWWPAMAEPKRTRRRTRGAPVKVSPSGNAGPDSWAGAS